MKHFAKVMERIPTIEKKEWCVLINDTCVRQISRTINSIRLCLLSNLK
jgi:hypothetical protein